MMFPMRRLTSLSIASMLGTVVSARNVCEDNGVCGGDKCGLYMAPSTIPNAGLGIFTAEPLAPGDVIGNGDIAIPIVDIDWNHGLESDGYFWAFSEYVWQGYSMGMQQETEDQDVEAVTAFCPGLDAAINCNPALTNTGKATPIYDEVGLHRGRDPGAGAFSPYHNGTTTAVASIPAGGELFKYYGNSWFETRTEDFGLLPLQHDYPVAERVLRTFSKFDLSEQGMDALWNIVRSMPWESRTSNAFPATRDDAIKGAQDGIQSLSQPSAIRSIAYLDEYGRCIDNIIGGPSTIEGAGHGAFATRFIEEGSFVTGSPLLHVPFRSSLNMYGDYRDEEDVVYRNESHINGTQLLMNYCYGHNSSTLLLCPYGNGVNYINHNPSRANVKVQWTPDGILSQRDSWLERDVSRMEWKYTVSLAFDYVATRDILPGEEIFLDYGSEWEEAWNKHVQDWEAPEGAEEYVSASSMNARLKGKLLRTTLEQEIDPYPYNLELRCHSNIERRKYMSSISEWIAEERGKGCDILYRVQENGTFFYEVVFPNEIERDGEPKTLSNVPRQALKFVDKPYTTDLHLGNAFRHEIMIPDEIFPDKWRNLMKD